MDWRLSLTQQSRADVIQKLIEVVRLAAPTQDQTKLAELASQTEQSIFEKSNSKQEYILLLQQKISNLQAKIAVIQKGQSNFPSNPVIAPKFPTGPPVGAVPVNLRNMVLNLQQQQAQNIHNSLKNHQAAEQALQAAKLAQKTLIGVQMQSSSKTNSPQPMSLPVQTQSIQSSSNSKFSFLNCRSVFSNIKLD